MQQILLRWLAWVIIACCLAIVAASYMVRHTVRTVYVHDPALATVPGIRPLDPNSELFDIIRSEPNRTAIHWKKMDVHLMGGGRVRMRADAENVKVMGELPGGRTYPVVIDTGNPAVAAVTSTVVLDAGLGVHPLEDPDGFRGGVCHIPALKMGDVTIANLACECWLGHYEKRVLGRATWIERDINVGLGLLQQFRHVRIDCVGKEVEFSSGHFVLEERNDWRSYPMLIDRDPNQEERLVVRVPLDGHIVTAGLDTGADPGLILTENRRAEILPRARILGHTRSRMATPGGHLPCREITLETLSIADMTLMRAAVHVLEDDNPHGPDDLTLGMGYFRDTAIVLDFEHDLLWIRNRPPARP